jgi:hypothetical protein
MGVGGSLHGSAVGGTLHGAGPHVFDTGLHRAQRTTVRQAIADRLAPLLKKNGGYLRSIKMLPRPIRSEGDDDGLGFLGAALQGQAPSIAIALGRKTYEQTDAGEANLASGVIDFAIYVIGGHSRGHVEGRLEADVTAAADRTADPGIDVILEHVEEYLLGQELGIKGTLEMRAVEEDEVLSADDYTVWEQRYTVKVERKINPRRASTQIATSLEGRHRLAEIPLVHPMSPTVTTVEPLEEG